MRRRCCLKSSGYSPVDRRRPGRAIQCQHTSRCSPTANRRYYSLWWAVDLDSARVHTRHRKRNNILDRDVHPDRFQMLNMKYLYSNNLTNRRKAFSCCWCRSLYSSALQHLLLPHRAVSQNISKLEQKETGYTKRSWTRPSKPRST